jgi:hypothetical protein
MGVTNCFEGTAVFLFRVVKEEAACSAEDGNQRLLVFVVTSSNTVF